MGSHIQVIDLLHVGLNEQQHRLFKDLNLQSRKVVAGLNPATPVVEEEEGEESEGSGDPVVNAALDKDKSGPRCTSAGNVMTCPHVQPTWRKSNAINVVRQVISP